jgi:hypothetical protein
MMPGNLLQIDSAASVFPCTGTASLPMPGIVKVVNVQPEDSFKAACIKHVGNNKVQSVLSNAKVEIGLSELSKSQRSSFHF